MKDETDKKIMKLKKMKKEEEKSGFN